MKSIVLALAMLALSLVTASSFGGNLTATAKPSVQAYGYIYGVIDTTNHRAVFNSTSPGCSTPQHKGYMPLVHNHDYQTMHNNACSTSGNWWNAAHTIWQLKRSWCVCEGWGGLDCGFTASDAIKAWCYY